MMNWYTGTIDAKKLDNSDAPLFLHPDWAKVVETLGARFWLGIEKSTCRQVSLFVWQRGPVRIGFLGFPVTPGWAAEQMLRDAKAFNWPERVDLIRTNVSMLDEQAQEVGGGVRLPESVIPNMAVWPARAGKKIRKDLKWAERHGTTIRIARHNDAKLVHAIYAGTVKRHNGRLRYSEEYFRRLLMLVDDRVDFRACIAVREDLDIGFCLGAITGSRAWYLHAGASPEYRRYGAADMLVHDLIAWARDAECQQLSFMPSPVAQPGLAQFKCKWGDADGHWLTRDWPQSIAGRMICLWLTSKARLQ